MKRFKISVAIVGCLVVIAFVVGLFFPPTELGELTARWELAGNTFKIRVSRYAERRFRLVGGAHYVFESAALDSDEWNEIMRFRHDDPDYVPQDQVRFINNHIGYVFMGWMYAVTSDGGSSWHIWRADKNLSGWECCNYGLIQDVRIAPDGSGMMRLNPIPQRQGEVPELQTKDYGREWSIK